MQKRAKFLAKDTAIQLREGPTYESNIATNLPEEDLQFIPGKPCVSGESEDSFVTFDLETTSLDTKTCDIIQISAICGEDTFDKYILQLDQ